MQPEDGVERCPFEEEHEAGVGPVPADGDVDSPVRDLLEGARVDAGSAAVRSQRRTRAAEASAQPQAGGEGSFLRIIMVVVTSVEIGSPVLRPGRRSATRRSFFVPSGRVAAWKAGGSLRTSGRVVSL